jgi:hypothetical protein
MAILNKERDNYVNNIAIGVVKGGIITLAVIGIIVTCISCRCIYANLENMSKHIPCIFCLRFLCKICPKPGSAEEKREQKREKQNELAIAEWGDLRTPATNKIKSNLRLQCMHKNSLPKLKN